LNQKTYYLLIKQTDQRIRGYAVTIGSPYAKNILKSAQLQLA